MGQAHQVKVEPHAHEWFDFLIQSRRCCLKRCAGARVRLGQTTRDPAISMFTAPCRWSLTVEPSAHEWFDSASSFISAGVVSSDALERGCPLGEPLAAQR